MRWLQRVWWLWWLLVSASVQAHQASDAYLNVRIQGHVLETRLDVALTDLDRELVLDIDGNHQLTWREVRNRWPEFEQLAREGVQVLTDPPECTSQTSAPPQLEDHSDGRYAVLQSTWQCAKPVTAVMIQYQLFGARDATHRGLLRITGPVLHNTVLVPGGPVQRFAISTASGSHPHGAQRQSFAGFVLEGMRHIGAGFDHILFLISLLLVAVWQRQGLGWTPRPDTAAAWKEALRLVTAFTVAHSITLTLAASGVLAPPTRWVEFLIAASVGLAALDNLRPFLAGRRWPLVFAFGLVHGFGFAGPLQALGLRQGELAIPLLGFNLGVELGQLVLVTAFLPWAVWWRHKRAYRLWAVQGGSIVVFILALLWMIERGFETDIWNGVLP